jgi:phosphate transport system protein
MSSPHILGSYDAALGELDRQLIDMCTDVQAMVAKASKAFNKHDVVMAQAVVQSDLAIDAKHDAIKANVLEIITRFQPMARDLREVIAIERINSSLERMADHAKSISKRTIASSMSQPAAATQDIVLQLCSVLDVVVGKLVTALIERSVALADEIRRDDQRIDQLYDDLVHSVIADIQDHPESAHDAAHRLFAAKSLERIGDHATNVAEEIRFMMIGEAISATRR